MADYKSRFQFLLKEKFFVSRPFSRKIRGEMGTIHLAIIVERRPSHLGCLVSGVNYVEGSVCVSRKPGSCVNVATVVVFHRPLGE